MEYWQDVSKLTQFQVTNAVNGTCGTSGLMSIFCESAVPGAEVTPDSKGVRAA